MSDLKKHEPIVIAEKLVKYCMDNQRKFVFISGNGGAGKTEFAKIIEKEAQKYGHVNVLDMDDFVVDTKLRNSASVTWIDHEKGEQAGRYTTAFAASYFLQNVKAIICNIEKANNIYHWPKKAKTSEESRLLHGDAILTIIEGTGTVFLDKCQSKSISIFMECEKEVEVSRRIKRAKFSNEKDSDEVIKKYDERNSQYKANIEPFKKDFDVILESQDNFDLLITIDNLDIL
jgi:uridine kinase